MIEKEYYRFNEFEKRFNLSFSDLKYLVENSKIDLFFYLERNKFIIGGWIKDGGFSGFGSVSYRGLAKISQDEQLKIVADKKVIVKNFSLLNKEMISAPNIEYPFESELPNQFLHSWEPRPLNKISWRTVPAKLFPKEQEHSYRTLKKGLDEVVSAFTGKEQVDNEKTSALLDRLPKKEFYSAGITLSMNDICLLHSDLVLLNIIQSSDENIIIKDKHYESQILKKTITFDNDFHELLAKILKANVVFSAKQIFKLLTEESRLEEDERSYDTKNILLDEVDGVLVWQDRLSRKNEKKCSLRTLENTLTKIRIAIR